MKQRKLGFTLIELLVVIVIIGILSTIAIPQFSGYFNKARNAQTTFLVGAYKRALERYLAIEGSYPPISGPICLGATYPAEGSFGLGECYSTANIRNLDPAFNAALLPHMGNFIDPATNILVGAGGDHRGVIFTENVNATLDGVPAHFRIEYYLEGIDQDCKFPVVGDAPAGFPHFESTTNNNSLANSGGHGNTFCRVVFPQPRT